MTSFLVEAYTPHAGIDEIEARASSAAEAISRDGRQVRYLRSIYVAEDETCFHLFDADSADLVRQVSEHAQLDPQRIVEAVELAGDE